MFVISIALGGDANYFFGDLVAFLRGDRELVRFIGGDSFFGDLTVRFGDIERLIDRFIGEVLDYLFGEELKRLLGLLEILFFFLAGDFCLVTVAASLIVVSRVTGLGS